MFFGLTIEKIFVIIVIAALVIGPERLPTAAAGLANLVKQIRAYGRAAKARVEDEFGDEFTDVDWKRLDPRQYDPRRINMDALNDPPTSPTVKRPSEAALLAARRPAVAPGRPIDTAADVDPASNAGSEPTSTTDH